MWPGADIVGEVGRRERIVVAMSGGVDSSVAAALLHEQGHEVVGVWMRLHDGADQRSEFRKSCCSLDAADDARRVAGQLGIPFFILDLEREFAAGVLDPFVASYMGGRTPSPCVDCNTYVKFGALLGRARLLYGAGAVATGHYARIDAVTGTDGADGRDGADHAHDADHAHEENHADGADQADGAHDADGADHADGTGGRRWRLLTAADPAKDQSYFLYGLRQDQLARTRFPLGELAKPDVRAIARGLGLATAEAPESQEICFVAGGDYRETLRERAGWQETPGPVVDVDGSTVGQHRGAAAYTVGQRTGLGVAVGERRYVTSIDVERNLVRLGRREDLQRRSFVLEAMTFVSGHAPRAALRCSVRIRHRGALVGATVHPPVRGRGWTVETDEPVWAPAPGQAAVLYAGDEVLGGGRIAPD